MENNPELNINDLATIANIIDIACKRGAFGASEIKDVGLIYEKVQVFVQAAVAQANATQSDAAVNSQINTPPEGE